MRQVSVGWQILATFFIPTGIYAFKRIDKLRNGILIYGITWGVWIGSILVTMLINDIIDYDVLVAIFGIIQVSNLIISFVLPMWYMEKWSSEWNKKIAPQANI